MPTPVSTARQCLTDEAARALDDAVAVARRRSHAQTTSLHAVSALLALPSAVLRDACGRARSLSYSPRLQFRALELSVGVSLDRLPTAGKSSATSAAANDGPPISNSLMAAIKRSQANQRRHPESFHYMILHQHHNQQNQNQNQNVNQTTSFLKVELKHFILSILDDPIVSRVFGEAGFRSYDIKLALLQPPPNNNRFFYSRMNRPVFLCNLESGGPPGPGLLGLPFVNGPDQNTRRIVEVLLRKEKRNPLLMGVHAKTALKVLMESVSKGKMGILPPELAGLSVVCVEKEIVEFVNGEISEEMMVLRLNEVSCLVEKCVVSFGDVEVFARGADKAVNSVKFVVERLRRLLEPRGGGGGGGGGGKNNNVWLVGVAETSDVYSKFLGLFPTIEKDWDLNLLTVTNSNSSSSSATTSMEGLYPRSSLMGSFIPFGGFFSTPSEFRSPMTSTNASQGRCDTCNEKYEQEVADILKVGPATTSAFGHSPSLPWLQKVNVDTDKGLDLVKANEDKTSLNAKIFGLQRKWSDICQHAHHNRSLPPEFDFSQTRAQQAASLERFPFVAGFNESSSKISRLPTQLQSNTSPSKQILPISSAPFDAIAVSINTDTDQPSKVSKIQQCDMPCTWISSSSIAPVTTDLGLGTIYASAAHEPDTPKLCDHKRHLQHLSDSQSTDFDAVNESSTTHQIAVSSSPCSGRTFEGKFDSVDFKSLCQFLTEKVCWQNDAVYAISRAVSLCRSGAGKRGGSSRVRADTWLAFLGQDRVGKRKIALALAECLLGSQESLIYVDLGSQDGIYPLNSNFKFQSSYCHDVLRRKTVVDYIAGELSKKPNSVIFLENVDKADFLLQNSLFQAIRTGRFPYSLGREIGTNNAIFILTSVVYDGCRSFVSDQNKHIMFAEERILEAKRCEMQLLPGNPSEDAKRYGNANVKVALRRESSKPTLPTKRKLVQSSDSKKKAKCKTQKPVKETSTSRSYLDLNMPLNEEEEVEEGINININDSESEESEIENSESWLHDFCDQVDDKVAFKPFDLDSLAEQVIKSIDIKFQKAFGSDFLLEIEYEVMEQILAAAWLFGKKKTLEDWVENVLGRSFSEAQKKYHNPDAKFVMKLVKCESNFVEEHAHHGVWLPARINLN